MKAFEFKESRTFSDETYPEDCVRILEYLEDSGTLNISISKIPDYYHRYCEDCCCAGWLILNDDRLFEFANWLSEQVI